MRLPSFAESHGCKPVDQCEEGILRSLGEGGYPSAFAVRSRLRPTQVGGFRPTKRVERCHGRKPVELHKQSHGDTRLMQIAAAPTLCLRQRQIMARRLEMWMDGQRAPKAYGGLAMLADRHVAKPLPGRGAEVIWISR